MPEPVGSGENLDQAVRVPGTPNGGSDGGATAVAPTPLNELAVILADSVLLIAGVLRLEPSLRNSLNQMIRRTQSKLPTGGTRSRFGGTDGILVSTRNGLTQVVIELSLDTRRSAVDVVEEAQLRVIERLEEHRHQPGPVTVLVLGIESSEIEPSGIERPPHTSQGSDHYDPDQPDLVQNPRGEIVKIRPLALLAGGAAAYYFLKTPKGRARLQQLKERGRSRLAALRRPGEHQPICRRGQEADRR